MEVITLKAMARPSRSGVRLERSPGVKDLDAVAAFVASARGAEGAGG